MPESGRYVYFLGIFAVALVLRELLLRAAGDWFAVVLICGLVPVLGTLWWLRSGGALPKPALYALDAVAKFVDPSAASPSAEGGTEAPQDLDAPLTFETSKRGHAIRKSMVDDKLPPAFDDLATRLGAVRKRNVPGTRKESTSRKHSSPRDKPVSTAWARSATSDRVSSSSGSRDAEPQAASSWAKPATSCADPSALSPAAGPAFDESGRAIAPSSERLPVPRPRERSGRLYTGRNEAQVARVRRRIGPASSRPHTSAEPTMTATPVISAEPVITAPKASGETPSPSQESTVLHEWLAQAGAARFRQDLVDNDLWSSSLLTKLAEAGRLRDALREAGISSVGAREALTLAVEEATT